MLKQKYVTVNSELTIHLAVKSMSIIRNYIGCHFHLIHA